jgi:hypothetical protein
MSENQKPKRPFRFWFWLFANLLIPVVVTVFVFTGKHTPWFTFLAGLWLGIAWRDISAFCSRKARGPSNEATF